MMNKLMWVIVVLMWLVWAGDYFYFRHQGPRFTANQGQELCEVVKEIVKHSYGYQQSGKALPNCQYIKK